MPTYSRYLTDPAYETFIRKHAPILGWQSKALYDEFTAEFGVEIPRNNFIHACRHLHNDGHIVPPSGQRDLSKEVLRLHHPRGCLITSDWQVPFYDHDWAGFVFQLASAYGVEAHIINGDGLDFHSLSKFDSQVSGKYGISLEEEAQAFEEILMASIKHFKTYMNMGNHEWRLYRHILQADISPERFLRLFETESRPGGSVTMTEFSYIVIEDEQLGEIRVTHPKNYSMIATTVPVRIAEKEHMHVIGGHGHALGFSMDRSGKYLCYGSGGMFDYKMMDYIMSVDSINPRMNQGAVILTPDHELKQLNPLNIGNREKAIWLAKQSRRYKPSA